VADEGFLQRLFNRLATEAADVRLLRASLLKQRLSTLVGTKSCCVGIAGVGPIVLRPRTTDLASFRRVFDRGEYRIPDVAADAVQARYQAILAAGRTPVVVDAGAYVGATALWFARCFPRAHVVAIEPDEESFRLLVSNTAGHSRITVIDAAVAAEQGYVRLVRVAEEWGTQVSRSDEGSPSITMDEAFAAVSDGEPFIAKINIEGFESDVFSGSLDWLDKVNVLFVEPHDWLLPSRHSSRSFQRVMGARDFDLFIVGPHLCYART